MFHTRDVLYVFDPNLCSSYVFPSLQGRSQRDIHKGVQVQQILSKFDRICCIYMLCRGIAPPILNRGIRWGWAVGFPSKPLYSQERSSVSIDWEAHWVPGARLFVLEKRKICGPIELRTLYRPAGNDKILSKTLILYIPHIYFQLFFPVTNDVKRRWIG